MHVSDDFVSISPFDIMGGDQKRTSRIVLSEQVQSGVEIAEYGRELRDVVIRVFLEASCRLNALASTAVENRVFQVNKQFLAKSLEGYEAMTNEEAWLQRNEIQSAIDWANSVCPFLRRG